jgi:uncharacterized protein (TIGR00730 family)
MDKKTLNSNEGPVPAIQRVAVYAASSRALAPVYHEAAGRLGRILAGAGLSVVYGGGSTGLMGAMADAALAAGGEVHGIVPGFLMSLESSHQGLTRMEVVEDMRLRKHRMLEGADAVVTLPGGCGTYEEVFEAMTLKRLGQWLGPIVLVNTRGFYDRFIEFLQHSVSERFMDQQHADMWAVVDEPEEVPAALANASAWSRDAIRFANVRA